MTITHVCCRHTTAIYRGPGHEGAIVRCLWCTQAMMVRNGVWENEEEAGVLRRERPPAESTGSTGMAPPTGTKV